MTTKRRRVLLTAVVCLWLAFIWGHSLVPGDLSSEESSRFVVLLRPVFEAFGVSDPHLMSHVIRKCAHFLEYAVLGALSWAMAGAWTRVIKVGYAIVAVICVTAPVVDELIQLQVPGRDGRVSDVVLDLAGCTLAVIISRFAERTRERQAA